MCYRTIKINNNFKEVASVLNNHGYSVDVRPFESGVLMLWKGERKFATRKGPRIKIPCCQTVTLQDLPKLLKGRRKSAKQCKNGIWRIHPKTREAVFFKTVKEAARAIGVRSMNIYKCANIFSNELKTAYGYEWTYEYEEKQKEHWPGEEKDKKRDSFGATPSSSVRSGGGFGGWRQD